MSIEWAKQSFASLKYFWEDQRNSSDMSEDALALKGRYGDINCLVESDRVWPTVSTPMMCKFKAAYCGVLSRLPKRAFSRVESRVRIIVDDPSVCFLAQNVQALTSATGRRLKGDDVVIFFRSCLEFPVEALMGLIAHELAHSFVGGQNYAEDEALVNQKARDWGFGYELDCLERSKEQLRAASSG